MLNSTITAIMAQYGTRVFAINFDNNASIWLGFNDHTLYSDVEFIKLDSINPSSGVVTEDECVKVHTNVNINGQNTGYSIYHCSEYVQSIGVLDEDSADYRPDPIIIK